MKKVLSVILALALLLFIAAVPAQAFGLYEERAIIGDVNGNEAVEIDDVTFLQRKLIGIPLPFDCYEKACDADEDGFVTIFDVTYLQRWLIGIETRLNIGDNVISWPLDSSTAIKADGTSSADIIITRICQNYFYASPITPLPVEYKLKGRLSDNWCVGDKVYCTYGNILHTESYYFIEGDLLTIEPSTFEPDPDVCYKPVIYLYPEEETEVSVSLELDGEFTCTYPEYDNGWQVTASPDGILTDKNGNTYPYLFWEGRLNADYDLSEGFCIKGGDTEAFLTDALTTMGLNEKEIRDFSDFWLSFMKDNPYNVISFQTDAYTDAAKLSISPQPDTVIRVFMTWYSSDEAVDIPAQTLSSAQRNGFTAVEWGGQKLK